MPWCLRESLSKSLSLGSLPGAAMSHLLPLGLASASLLFHRCLSSGTVASGQKRTLDDESREMASKRRTYGYRCMKAVINVTPSQWITRPSFPSSFPVDGEFCKNRRERKSESKGENQNKRNGKQVGKGTAEGNAEGERGGTGMRPSM